MLCRCNENTSYNCYEWIFGGEFYLMIFLHVITYFACNKILNEKWKLLDYKLSKNLYINQLHLNLLLL